MKRVCLRSIVGAVAIVLLASIGRASSMPPVIMEYLGADFDASGNSTGAFKLVNLSQDPISAAQIDLSKVTGVAFEAANGGTNLFHVNAAGSHGIDQSALSGQPVFMSDPNGSSTSAASNLFPILNLNFNANTFNPGATFAFDIPVALLDANGNMTGTAQSGTAVAGGLVSVNRGTEVDTGTLFVPPPSATSDHNASVALLTPSGLSQGGQGGVPEPASLLVWSLFGLGGLGLRRKVRAAAV